MKNKMIINTLAELYEIGETEAEKSFYLAELITNIDNYSDLKEDQKSNLIIAVMNALDEFEGEKEFNQFLQEYLRRHEKAILEGVELKSSLILQ